MNPAPLLFIGLLLAALAAMVAFAIWNGPRYATLRAMRRTPKTPVASAAEGVLVRVTGRVEVAGKPLVGPVSGRACVVTSYVVTEVRGKRVVVHRQAVEGVEFELVDESGRAVVRPRGKLRAALAMDARRKKLLETALPEALMGRDVVAITRQAAERGELHEGQMTYSEGVVAPGAVVTVVGRARWEPVPPTADAAGYREQGRRLVIEPPEPDALLVSDLPGARA